MIDVLSLSRIVGAFTLQKGLEYSRRGAVLSTEITETEPGQGRLRISGRVAGSHPMPYQVDVVVTLNDSSIHSLTGICSCPVRMSCKHVVAMVISGLSARGQQQGKAVVPTRPA